MADAPTTGHGLYLHIPFCASICPYCDFSVLKGDDERRQRFVDALIGEISLYRDYSGSFDTIYFGGGTPSILTADQLTAILEAIDGTFTVETPPWVSLEANPEDVDEGVLADWQRLGVRTVSLGVQSFDRDELAFLGRTHSPEASRRAVERALAAGFESVSLDLIYGLPGQSLQSWRRQLETAIELAPPHLSCYQLTIHDKTVFGVRKRRGQFTELGEELQAEFFYEAHRRLGSAGYEGYEVSNFAAAPENRSRHNRKYWDHTPYLGLGPAAHSFDGQRRWWNEWKEGPWSRAVRAGQKPVVGSESLSGRDLALERLMLGLRTSDGVALEEIDRAYGTGLSSANREVVAELERQGKLRLSAGRLQPTLEGLATAEAVALAFAIGGEPGV